MLPTQLFGIGLLILLAFLIAMLVHVANKGNIHYTRLLGKVLKRKVVLLQDTTWDKTECYLETTTKKSEKFIVRDNEIIFLKDDGTTSHLRYTWRYFE